MPDGLSAPNLQRLRKDIKLSVHSFIADTTESQQVLPSASQFQDLMRREEQRSIGLAEDEIDAWLEQPVSVAGRNKDEQTSEEKAGVVLFRCLAHARQVLEDKIERVGGRRPQTRPPPAPAPASCVSRDSRLRWRRRSAPSTGCSRQPCKAGGKGDDSGAGGASSGGAHPGAQLLRCSAASAKEAAEADVSLRAMAAYRYASHVEVKRAAWAASLAAQRNALDAYGGVQAAWRLQRGRLSWGGPSAAADGGGAPAAPAHTQRAHLAAETRTFPAGDSRLTLRWRQTAAAAGADEDFVGAPAGGAAAADADGGGGAPTPAPADGPAVAGGGGGARGPRRGAFTASPGRSGGRTWRRSGHLATTANFLCVS